MSTKKITAVLRYLISIYLLSILFFTVFRIIFYVFNSDMAAGVESKHSFLIQAMFKGLQFDNFIASYIIALPLLVLSVLALYNKISRKVVFAINTLLIIIYALAFIISISDIPYFAYFFTHLGVAAFGWFEFGGTTAGLIFQPQYYSFIALTVVSVAIFIFAILRLGRQLLRIPYADLKKKDYRYYIPLTILVYGLCFLGMRGSLQRYPLRAGYAYFCNHSFFNQLGINPCFSLMNTLTSSEQYNNVDDQMSTDDAFLLVHNELKIDPLQEPYNLNREVQPQGEIQKPNIVIILLESMSSRYLDYEYNGSSLTPYLHELIEKSYYFENFYSSGVHTNNGIASTLYGFPCLFDKPSLKNEVHYTGLPVNLHQLDYQNLFFITGNPNYDHMNLFLMESGFDHIYSQYDYPPQKVVNKYGVQDDFLLEYGLERLNEAAQKDKPFLGVFLTVSNHGPYIVPPKYKDSADADDKKMVRFVDDAVKDFMKNASQQAWFENTIFVLLGDHGANLDQPKYDMPIERNHIPLIIYSHLFEDAPRHFDCFCGQIDVFPTLMGMLNAPYINNSLGIDIFREQRPYMYFVSDNKLGCIDKDYFYIRDLTTKSDLLYDLHDPSCKNIMQQEASTGESMKAYGVSMMVTADYLIKNHH